MNTQGKKSGFTLTELMVAVAISGILLSAAIPSFKTLFLRNTTIAYTDDFKMALYIAQSEAVKRNSRVSITTKTNGNNLWEDGWDVFQDNDEDGSFDSGEELIQTYTPDATNYTLKSLPDGGNFNTDISFNALGEPITSAGLSASAEFRICGPDNDTTLSRTITTSFSGRIVVTAGTTACP